VSFPAPTRFTVFLVAKCRRTIVFLGGRFFLYNADLIRTLCRDIAAENDLQKAEELLSLLQAVIKDDHEEVRVRMAFLAKKYPITASQPEPAS
jgi:hypothetical protein